MGGSGKLGHRKQQYTNGRTRLRTRSEKSTVASIADEQSTNISDGLV
jgi:hypothetical protein